VGSHWSVLWSFPQKAVAPNYQAKRLWMASDNDGVMLTTTGTGRQHSRRRTSRAVGNGGRGPFVGAMSRLCRPTWTGSRARWRSTRCRRLMAGLRPGRRPDDHDHQHGRSWQVVPQAPMLIEAQYVSGTTIAVGSWAQGNWPASGEHGRGRHWAKHRLPPPGLQDVAGQGILQFSRHGAGLWVEGGELWVTSDFGHRWRQVHAT